MKQSSLVTLFAYCIGFLASVLGACPRVANAAEVSGAPSAEATVQSQELMKQGAARFAEGNWQAALLAYRKAWALKPHPAVAANMAAAEIKLGMYLEAASHLKYALNHLPPVQVQKRDAVEQQLERVRAHLVAVSLSANRDGVEISIDGKPVGRTPLLEEILLEPGHHAIRAEYAELTQTKAIDVQAGGRIQLAFDLHGTRRPPRPSAVAATPPQPFATGTGHNLTRTWMLIGGAAGTALGLGIGVAMRIQANEERQDARTLRAQINSAAPSSGLVTGDTCVRRDETEACDLLYRNVQAIERDDAISTGAFVAAGVLGVATVAAALLWPSKNRNARSSAVSVIKPQVTPWSVSTAYGLSASLRF